MFPLLSVYLSDNKQIYTDASNPLAGEYSVEELLEAFSEQVSYHFVEFSSMENGTNANNFFYTFSPEF